MSMWILSALIDQVPNAACPFLEREGLCEQRDVRVQLSVAQENFAGVTAGVEDLEPRPCPILEENAEPIIAPCF